MGQGAGWSAADLRTIAQHAVENLGAVGTAVSVVHEDQVLLCEGFGRRDLGSEARVDAETLFAIGSSTKAFTTAAVAVLADEGRLDWDRPVREFMPAFALKDPFASAEITPRDLGCHRSGLPRHEAVWYKSTLSRAELVERVRHLEPSRPFRTAFQYQNMMFTTLGHLVERVSGSTWETFTTERLLAPLGMTRTNFSVATSLADANRATPYGERDGAPAQVPFAAVDAIGPAGSINSCARDMASWLRLHLGDGAVDGTRVLSAAAVANLHRPNIVLPESGRDPRHQAPAYALGWFTEVYQGVPVIHHGGNIDGFTALVLLAPAQRLGVAVLTNQNASVVPAAIAYAILDRVAGLPERDWNAYLGAERAKMLTVVEQGGDFAAERVPNTKPSHALEAYAGEFEHPAYGTMRIASDGEGLTLTYHVWPEPQRLEYFHYDTFVLRATLADLPMAMRVLFRLGVDGRVEALEIPLEPQVAPIVFSRRVAAPILGEEELQVYAGDYLVAGVQPIRVDVGADHTLTAQSPGQAALTLVATGDHRFAVKGVPGVSVEFEIDADGRCQGGRLSQPSGILPVTRAPRP